MNNRVILNNMIVENKNNYQNDIKTDLFLKNTKFRYSYLDYTRGFFIIVMIVYHFSTYFYNTINGVVEFILANLGGIIAPNFLMISGFSFIYFLNKRNLEKSSNDVMKEVVLKGLLMYLIVSAPSLGIGELFGVHSSIQYWSIFKIIAVGMIVTYFLNRLKGSKLWLFIFAIVGILLGYIYFLTNTPILWFFCYGYYLGDFAFFPWVFFYVIGFLFGKYLIEFNEKGIKVSILKILFIPSLLLFIFGATYFIFYSPPEYLPHFISKIIENIGLFFVVLLIAFYRDYKIKNPILVKSKNLITEYGNVSFSLYYIHIALIHAIQFVDAFILNNLLATYMNRLIFFTLTVSVLILISIGVIIWKKYNYIFGLEWIIRKTVGLILKFRVTEPEKKASSNFHS